MKAETTARSGLVHGPSTTCLSVDTLWDSPSGTDNSVQINAGIGPGLQFMPQSDSRQRCGGGYRSITSCFDCRLYSYHITDIDSCVLVWILALSLSHYESNYSSGYHCGTSIIPPTPTLARLCVSRASRSPGHNHVFFSVCPTDPPRVDDSVLMEHQR